MKKILPIIVIAVIVAGGTFFGGMKYAESKNAGKFLSRAGAQNFANMTPEERQQRMGQAGGRMTNGGQLGGMITGEILSKDEQSLTVKLRDGGSKIIFFSDSAEISKFEKGSAEDLQTGKTVVINGKANDDGSVTAQTIQIRPEMPIQPPTAQ